VHYTRAECIMIKHPRACKYRFGAGYYLVLSAVKFEE
jgi:hypothetical protein